MSQENVDVVRSIYKAFAERDGVTPFKHYAPDIEWDNRDAALNRDGPEAALAAFAPDVEWHDLPDQPDAEVHHGHAGVLSAIEQFFGGFEDYDVNLDEIIDHGEQVVVCVRTIGRGRASGARFEQRPAEGVWTLRNGLVVRVVWFGTRREAVEAAGLAE